VVQRTRDSYTIEKVDNKVHTVANNQWLLIRDGFAALEEIFDIFAILSRKIFDICG
jgi:hypothetical protein